MSKPQQRDTVDCLIAELTDAYEALARLLFAFRETDAQDWDDFNAVRDSIERAFQLVSDLQAERS
jgi:hypothetical protein